MWGCTGKTEAGLAREGNPASFPTIKASVLDEAHFLRISAVQHLLDGDVVVGGVKARIRRLEQLPVIPENLLESFLVDVRHGDPWSTAYDKPGRPASHASSHGDEASRSPRRSRDKFCSTTRALPWALRNRTPSGWGWVARRNRTGNATTTSTPHFARPGPPYALPVGRRSLRDLGPPY